jgi:hypothetical protein
MRTRVLFIVGLALLAAASAAGIATAAGGEGPVTLPATGEAVPTPAFGFSPKALSRTSYTPITAAFGQQVPAFPHPPAERQLLIELDRNLMVQVEGLPACNPRLQTGVTVAEACKGAVVGSGEETVQVAFAEDRPLPISARAQVLNGGERDGSITFFVYSRFGNPIDGSLITKVVFSRIHNGRFGWLADAELPQIAYGNGSLIDLQLQIGRRYAYEGRSMSVLSARCTDGKLLAHFQAGFEDGRTGEAALTSACVPKA